MNLSGAVPKSPREIWILLINFGIAGKCALTKSKKKGMISLYNYARTHPAFAGGLEYGNNKE